MAESVYQSALHNFISEYFKAQNAAIKILDEDFFQVNFPDGETLTFTYKPRIASENRSVELLAKGSKALRSIIEKCRFESLMSQTQVSYTEDSVSQSVGQKSCCNLCPYFAICENKTGCCDFCSYYKVCNSHIQNAVFERLGDIKESSPVTLIAFIYSVTISSDYAIHLKSQIRMMVLLSYPDGEFFDNVVVNQLEQLDFQPVINPAPIDGQMWEKLNQQAREALHLKLDPYMHLFRHQSETPLQDKVTSILNKYSDDYMQNFTSFSAEKLENLQSEALAYCEREFRRFAVVCEYDLENAFIIHTSVDKRELVFMVDGKSVSIDGEILLNRVNIRCSQCGLDIDKGYLCGNGHIICASCADICTICGKPACNFCGDRTYDCQTCGETICGHCAGLCSQCDSVSCGEHHFSCRACGEGICFDCMELCSVCNQPFCQEHIGACCECGKHLCADHQTLCSSCGAISCAEHTYRCGVCNTPLCGDHAVLSASKSMFVCGAHLAECITCGQSYSVTELTACDKCKSLVCPEHTVTCSSCGKSFCSEHVTRCPGCGKAYCDCIAFSACKYCGMEYCPDCLDDNGICTGCRTLKHTVPDPEMIRLLSDRDPAWARYKNYRTGRSGDMTVVLAQSVRSPRIAVIHPDRGVVIDKRLKLLDYLKLKGLRR